MLTSTPDGFFDLTVNADVFILTPALLPNLPGGLRGLEGNDWIIGTSDPELINGNQGNDTIEGNGGNDQLFGGRDQDLLLGGEGDDFLSGNLGDDQLFGDQGNDTLHGGKGNDLLMGGAGNDRLSGDLGTDTLIGGRGDDTLVLPGDGATADPQLANVIVDFTEGNNMIEVVGLTLGHLILEIASYQGENATLIRMRESGESLAWVLGAVPEMISERLTTTDSQEFNRSQIATTSLTPAPIRIPLETLPAPFETSSTANPATVIPIPDNPVLQVPEGFTVNVFAEGLDQPRWLAVTPTGDVLVTETPQNQIRLLRDLDGNGVADTSTIFAGPENGLNRPFGMAFSDGFFFVGNTDAVVRFPYTPGQLSLEGAGERIAELPTGGHWTRGLAISPDNQLFVSVGSRSNAEIEPLPRASVQVMNLDGSQAKTFAFGLRNPTGLDFHPLTGQLFTTVNERDGLGDELVPDFLAGLQPDEFYGWPYAYFTPDLIDPRHSGQRPDLVSQTQMPDVLFQSHSAPIGLQFYEGNTFPEKYDNGAFVAFRGSWNRREPTGYKVVFVPFDNQGNALGYYEDFLTGFLDLETETTWGRPTGLQVLPDGSVLITEEMNGRVYRVQAILEPG